MDVGIDAAGDCQEALGRIVDVGLPELHLKGRPATVAMLDDQRRTGQANVATRALTSGSIRV